MKLLGGIFLVRVHIQAGQANLQQISSLHFLDSNNVFHFTCKLQSSIQQLFQERALTCISCFVFYIQCLYLSPEHHPVFPWLQFDPSGVSKIFQSIDHTCIHHSILVSSRKQNLLMNFQVAWEDNTGDIYLPVSYMAQVCHTSSCQSFQL